MYRFGAPFRCVSSSFGDCRRAFAFLFPSLRVRMGREGRQVAVCTTRGSREPVFHLPSLTDFALCRSSSDFLRILKIRGRGFFSVRLRILPISCASPFFESRGHFARPFVLLDSVYAVLLSTFPLFSARSYSLLPSVLAPAPLDHFLFIRCQRDDVPMRVET